MSKFQNSQRGFSAVEGLLFLVIVAIVGGTGWYIYNANMKTNSTYNAASQISQSTATYKKRAPASTAKTHTSDEAVAFTQKTYDEFLAAINNVGTSNTQPLGLVGLAAVKANLTTEMYAKAAGSHNGDAFSCASQFVPSKYAASLSSADKSNAKVAMVISNSYDASITTNGMTVSLDLASLKITAVTCPN